MKLFLTIVSLFFCIGLFSQITIDQSDYFKFGNQYYRGALNIGLDGIDLNTSSGANQTWDFSWLNESFTDTLRIIKADLTPFYAEFPEADFGITSNLSNYFYEEISPEGVSILGRVNYDIFNAVNIVYRYNNSGPAFQFPIEYNNAYNFDLNYRIQFPAFFPGSDSIRQFNNSFFEIEADAWGELQLPIGNFEVLRVKQTAYLSDTVYVYDFPPGWGEATIVHDTTITWLFYAKEIGYRLLSFNQRLNGSSKNLNWIKGFSITSTEDIESSQFKIRPQPANDFVQVESIEEGTYSIFSITGKLISSGNLSRGINSISVQNISQGIYIIGLYDKSGMNIYSHKMVISGN